MIFCIFTGTVYGELDNTKLTYSQNVKLRPGSNKISLLSVAVGLPVSLYLSFPMDLRYFINMLKHMKLKFFNKFKIFLVSECWCTFREMEYRRSRSSNLRNKRLDKAEMVLQGQFLYQLCFLEHCLNIKKNRSLRILKLEYVNTGWSKR